MTVLAGLSVAGVRPRPVSFPPPAESFAFDVGPGKASLHIGVRSGGRESTRITIHLADRQASFFHSGRTTAMYRLALASGGERRAVEIEVDPPAAVALVHPTAGTPLRRPSLQWEPAGPPLVPPPPRPATAGRPTAEASVDETDTYGLRLFGVPVRSAPRITAPPVATVSHGDRLEATCWARGDALTDGFPERPLGAYSSDVWFRVSARSGPGFIPDVRFSRRGNEDRLNLPACTDP